jgi:hypothetical protein
MPETALTNGLLPGTPPRPEKWIFLWFGRQRTKARKTAIDPGPVHAPSLNESPLVTLPALPFRRIVPSSRTPRTSANVLACPQPGEDQQSGLSTGTNQSYSIYSPLGAGDVATVKLEVPGSQPFPGVFKVSRAAAYQQKPRFHTNFYNNGPANYRNTRQNLGTLPALRSNNIPVPNPRFYLAEPMLPASHVSRQQNTQNQVGPGEHFSQSLAPAFVLENTSKLTTLANAAAMNNYSAKALSMHTEDIDVSAQYNLLISRMEASRAFPTFYNEALDPFLAPLKHLTDVLGRFRDQDGTYTKLVDLQEREGLMKCLLDDELARRSPFQAAMGLVLLSKLGLEWDY